MTEQEAVDYFKEEFPDYVHEEPSKKQLAYNMAIKAIEKQIPKKPTGNDECICPSCNTHNDVVRKRRNTVPYDIVYCWHCGQAMKI